MPLNLLSKLPGVETTIFTVMSALAREEGALNLSQGFPDFDAPAELLERVRYYLTHGHNQYAPMTGVTTLRQATAQKVWDLYGCKVDPESEITVTSGATEALFCAITAVVNRGDEVIVFDPAYDSYEPVVTLQGATTMHVPLHPPNYKVDWDRVADVVSERTRLIIVNTPHNPTGTIWDQDDIGALADIVADRNIYLLADEVYEHMVFDGLEHASLCRYPDLYARSFVVSSFGKTYHTTGWKIGYCVAPKALSAEFRRIHQFVTFTSITPVQLGLADFLRDHPEHHLQLSAFYQAKRDLFCGLLSESRFTVNKSAGSFFQLLDYSEYSSETDTDLAVRLTRQAKLASIPVSVFYERDPGHRMLRFCFAKDDDTLRAGAEILCNL
ncbi:MAG: methionine aminotransferase [Gammaproteobacteria bacterium]|nr:methionine aminotransferase [Gammaproteobacteria bacterium]